MSDHDIISNPSHYTSGRKFQPLDIILEWFPDDYLLGQTLKYLSRIGRKGDPLEDAMKSDVLLVHQWEGAPLTTDHGDLVRMITPQLYAWKGSKWIGEIEFRDYDEMGYWEKRGYSNTAEPWLNDRYS